MTPSIWLERTDARVSLQVEHIGRLAWCVDVGLRSKQEQRTCFETRLKSEPFRAIDWKTARKRGKEVVGLTCI
jgi:hypothetical protein